MLCAFDQSGEGGGTSCLVWHSDISDGIARTVLRILLAPFFLGVNNCDFEMNNPALLSRRLNTLSFNSGLQT